LGDAGIANQPGGKTLSEGMPMAKATQREALAL